MKVLRPEQARDRALEVTVDLINGQILEYGFGVYGPLFVRLGRVRVWDPSLRRALRDLLLLEDMECMFAEDPDGSSLNDVVNAEVLVGPRVRHPDMPNFIGPYSDPNRSNYVSSTPAAVGRAG